jgi:hypothetical protein
VPTAAELVSLKPDVIFGVSAPAIAALKAANAIGLEIAPAILACWHTGDIRYRRQPLYDARLSR